MRTIRESHSFPTMREADTFRTAYLNSWPYQGYSTIVSLTLTDDGNTIVTALRSESCD